MTYHKFLWVAASWLLFMLVVLSGTALYQIGLVVCRLIKERGKQFKNDKRRNKKSNA